MKRLPMIVLLLLAVSAKPVFSAVPGATEASEPMDGGWSRAPSAPSILVIEGTDTFIDRELDALGYGYDLYSGMPYAGMGLEAYDHVFVGLDGGTIIADAFAEMADYASGGGILHVLGGSATIDFVRSMYTNLVGCDTLTYNWTTLSTAPHSLVIQDVNYLAQGLPSSPTFNSTTATYYQLRVGDPDIYVAVENRDGHPQIFYKRIGDGVFDMSINSPRASYWTDPSDSLWANRVVANMLDQGASLPPVALIGSRTSRVDTVLTDLGIDHLTHESYTMDHIDFSFFTHVFVALNGGFVSDGNFEDMAAWTREGGMLHFMGGTALQDFVNSVDHRLLSCDTANYSWAYVNTIPHVQVVDSSHFLAAGLPATRNFVGTIPTYYMMRPDDPDMTVAAVNADGYPMLLSRFLGSGRLDWMTHAPDFTVIDDIIWLTQVVENMFYGGPPEIFAIEDVPGDQGGRVRVSWHHCPYDDPFGAPDSIVGYSLWRRIDAASPAPAAEADPGDRPLFYPPGDWDFVLSVPARAEQEYSVVAPTLCDSTEAGMCLTTFFVSADTDDPAVHFESAPFSGYSVDNLAPNVPEGLNVDYAGAGNALAWLESEADDFRYFKIYRGDAPDFVVDPQNPLHMTTAAAWTDPSGDFGVYYKISAVDFSGNESPAAGAAGVTGAGSPPSSFALMQNVPNPFNPRTIIAFSLPEAAAVTLRIFDLNGREVARLLDGAACDRGRNEAVWDGRDRSGRRAAAGTYVYRIEAGGEMRSRLMMLVK